MNTFSELVHSISDSIDCLVDLNLNDRVISYYSNWDAQFASSVSAHSVKINRKDKNTRNLINFLCTYLRTQNCFEDEYQIRTQDSGRKWVLSRWKVIERDQCNDPTRIVGSFVDISQRKKIQEELRHSELLYSNLFNSISLGLLHLDSFGRIIQTNKAAESMLQMSEYELKGKPLHLVVHAVSEQFVPLRQGEFPSDKILKDPSRKVTMVMGLYKDTIDDISWLSVEAIPICNENNVLSNINVAMRDITDIKMHEKQQLELEKQLLISQKMESIGRLAGGVAHDFNNYLTTIIGYTELATHTLEKNDKAQNYMNVVLRSSQKASNLTRQLLAFSRPQQNNPFVLDANSVISDMEKILKRLVLENVEIRYNLSKSLKKVKIDPGHIEQLILNLVINAKDAISGPGKITITTSNSALKNEYANIEPGDYIRISVEDTGHGICEDDKPHIFEPFYTTKEENKGTGLGLAICYGIVKSNHGTIDFKSELGKGTTFSVYLPVSLEDEKQTVSDHSSDATVNTDDVIYVVEDDVQVRNVIVNSLKHIGYTAFEAGDGLEAIKRASDIHKIDLLITDVIMPRMGGVDLYSALKKKYSGLKVLFISGYSDMPEIRETIGLSSKCLLQKPFTPDELIAKIVSNAGG